MASLKKIVTIITGHLKDNPFVLTVLPVVSGRPSRSFLGPKLTKNLIFLRFTYKTHLFHLSLTRINAIIIVLYYILRHFLAAVSRKTPIYSIILIQTYLWTSCYQLLPSVGCKSFTMRSRWTPDRWFVKSFALWIHLICDFDSLTIFPRKIKNKNVFVVFRHEPTILCCVCIWSPFVFALDRSLNLGATLWRQIGECPGLPESVLPVWVCDGYIIICQSSSLSL